MKAILMTDLDSEPEVLTYRAYRERQALRAWARRRVAYEHSGPAGAEDPRGALGRLRQAMGRFAGRPLV